MFQDFQRTCTVEGVLHLGKQLVWKLFRIRSFTFFCCDEDKIKSREKENTVNKLCRVNAVALLAYLPGFDYLVSWVAVANKNKNKARHQWTARNRHAESFLPRTESCVKPINQWQYGTYRGNMLASLDNSFHTQKFFYRRMLTLVRISFIHSFDIS